MATLSLYGVVEELQALLDTYEMCETDQAKAECWQQIEQYVQLEIKKVDGIAGYLGRCENEAAFMKSESQRLAALAKAWSARQERLEQYCARVIEGLGRDAKGKWRKLEGKLHTLGLREGSPSVEITDEAAVPAEYKTLTITLPATAWEAFTHAMVYTPTMEAVFDDLKLAITKSDCQVAKCEIKKAIKGGATVDGADVTIGEPTLTRR